MKRKVPKREMRVLSYSTAKYVSENSKAAGYCSRSCHVASKNSRNKGDWQTQKMGTFNVVLQLFPFISKFMAHVKEEITKKISQLKHLAPNLSQGYADRLNTAYVKAQK